MLGRRRGSIAGAAGGLGPDAAIGMTSHGNLRRGLSVESPTAPA
ncbi:hypothetical protein [Streptomyces chryseus]|nr:hypothetical protein [Streptomyces chryseus]